MPNKDYKVQPITDVFSHFFNSNSLVNKVINKTSKQEDGFYVYVSSHSVWFYYKTNGNFNGPQRIFYGTYGYVLESYYENNTICGD